MTYSNSQKLFILLLGLVTMLGSFWYSVIALPRYEAVGRLLIIQKNPESDVFTLTKSAERIAQVLEEVVFSQVFLDEVLASRFLIEDDFGKDAEERIDNFEDRVSLNASRFTGVLTITSRRNDRGDALHLTSAVLAVLNNSSQKFHGAGESLELRVIDRPYVVDNKVKNFLIFNALGFIAGIALAILLLYLNAQRRQNSEDTEVEVPVRRSYQSSSEVFAPEDTQYATVVDSYGSDPDQYKRQREYQESFKHLEEGE